MSGDWIKMRTALASCPQVVRIACGLLSDESRTRVRIAAAVGLLHATWSIADAQTEDGLLPGYTPGVLDELVGCEGWTELLVDVGWADVSSDGIRLLRFEEHNGKSAKRRSVDADRKRSKRASASASEADKCPHPKRTESGLEKRREEYSLSLRSREDARGARSPAPEPEPKPRSRRKRVSEDELRALCGKHSLPDAATEAVLELRAYRVESRLKALTPGGWERNVRAAADDPEVFKLAVDTTIANGWQGLQLEKARKDFHERQRQGAVTTGEGAPPPIHRLSFRAQDRLLEETQRERTRAWAEDFDRQREARNVEVEPPQSPESGPPSSLLSFRSPTRPEPHVESRGQHASAQGFGSINEPRRIS